MVYNVSVRAGFVQPIMTPYVT